MGLMKQELECVEKIVKQRRLEMDQPKPVLDPIADFRVGWNAEKLASLKRRRGRAWNWQKAGLDERIRETEQHIKRINEQSATRTTAFQSLNSQEERKRLKHLEEQYAELKASLPKPESLVDIEQQIKSTNESIIITLREYDRVTKSSESWETQKDDLPPIFSPGIMRLSPGLGFRA
jgi:chromosome segregation ATPase